jgi:hypothetical protein
MAEQQMTLPEPQPGATMPSADDGVTASGKPPRKANKKASKKASKKAGKKASKKTGSKKASSKKTGSKKASSKKTGKKAGKKASKRTAKPAKPHGCSAIVHVMPSTEVSQLATWSEMSRSERRRALILTGAAVGVAAALYLLFRSGKASAASGKGSAPDSDPAVDDEKIDIDVEVAGTPLPPPIKLGNIPPLYTRVYQLFDRFVEGGMEFFANVGDSESKHNIFALNPAGVPLSKAGVERQMNSKTYGDEWSGKGTVPYTEYAEPEEAKNLGAMGLFQGVAGTIGQAGRRNGTALLAPLPVAEWMDPANQLAAFMELFGALYHEFGAKTPVAMRIAWGYPSKANKTDDPYYIDRAAKWAKRQQTTGVAATSFKNMTLRDHTVEEVAAYFRQFDYSPIVDAAKNAPRMAMAVLPLKPAVFTRLSQQVNSHPAFIGNDLT